MKIRPHAIIMAILQVALVVVPAEASVLVSNIDTPAIGSFPTVNSGQWLAQPFKTGFQPGVITGVRATVRIYDLMAEDMQFSIHEDNGGLPGALVDNGILDGLPAGSHYTSSTGISLAEDSTYWVMASCNAPSVQGQSHGWHDAKNSVVISDYGWDFLPGYANSLDLGNTWIYQEYVQYRSHLSMELIGEVIPEPASLSLIGIVSGGVFFIRRFFVV